MVFVAILMADATASAKGETMAEEHLIGGTSCALVDGETGVVASVVDGDTVKLDTGIEVRLIGIQAPKLPLDRPDFAAWPLAAEAKAALERLALGQPAIVRYGGTRRDRYGRALGQVTVLPEDSEEIWLQRAMLDQGFARVYSFPDNRQCLGALMNAEREARKSGLGVWSDPYYAIRAATDQALATEHDVYDLVEGTVFSVGERGPIVYLDFGRDWATDFTAVLSKEATETLTAEGLDVGTLMGRRVRLRGWIESHDGASMRVTHPEQLELLDDGE
ncbi:thermonuclease family protein [Kaistia dalseonensis]|uniref:Endonuclease YncB(Thermonuclease family) n=2 Tax=Kaistia dalseonensis TaxID=410840 RepID=A0ABU0H4I3_9HYPH|nr:thermonuclease family protein [Kaistia dalseonensis]MDQ0437223.1 endonuclease YncB(thermonuclease family) [Kaistia dalseonensis]